MTLRVGIDTVEVAAVEAALAAHGDRYLERVYTPREVADCGGSAERLAARFAAKEATLKALRASDGGVPWPSVEVLRDPAGFTDLALTGRAAALAAEAGISELAVSLTHEAGLASAVVVAESVKVSGAAADR
ncbi:MAG: holo-[acyl-carrier protein] synthase [Solirubrobacteraceae bacterium]|jgi:holo-[acyl-carrier protein] synthase|nr:holo-[acyl-carrier protein] synthase [Solirubrobacteraceae bacterium]